ncbi:MAG: RHS repeat domain-containing protein, partial [Opitutaceae bacterium]
STVSIEWDAGNRPYEIVDSTNGTIKLTFDKFDRLKQEVSAQGVVDYTYDAAGRRATMTVAGGTPFIYTFDDANRLNTITQGTSVGQVLRVLEIRERDAGTFTADAVRSA